MRYLSDLFDKVLYMFLLLAWSGWNCSSVFTMLADSQQN
jgi:hypothetical protein